VAAFQIEVRGASEGGLRLEPLPVLFDALESLIRHPLSAIRYNRGKYAR
jgi:hypothetical protein